MYNLIFVFLLSFGVFASDTPLTLNFNDYLKTMDEDAREEFELLKVDNIIKLQKVDLKQRIRLIQHIEDHSIESGTLIKDLQHSFRMGREGNGGDIDALQIQEMAFDMVNQIRTQQDLYFKNNKRYDQINLQELESLVESTKIFLVNHKLCSFKAQSRCVGQRGFVLKNYPSTLEIHINIERWRALSNEQKIKLLAHEYFGLLGVEQGVYNISSDLVANAVTAKNYLYVSCMISFRERNTETRGISTLYSANVAISVGSSKSTTIMLEPLHKFSKSFEGKYMAAVVASAGHFRVQISEPRKISDNFFVLKSDGVKYTPEVVLISDDINTTKEFHTPHHSLTLTCHGI